MGRRQVYTNEQVLAALAETKGMVYLAAQRLGCGHGLIYERARRCPAVAEALKAERGRVIDAAELKLYNAILAGEPWAIQMALKTLGKDRGYVERTELTGQQGGPVEARVKHDLQSELAPYADAVKAFLASLSGPGGGDALPQNGAAQPLHPAPPAPPAGAVPAP